MDIEPLNVSNLNEDCLIEVFKYLRDKDLYSLTKVSTYFRKITCYNAFKHCKVHLSTFKIDDVFEILEKFGPFLRNIEISYKSMPGLSSYHVIPRSDLVILNLKEFCPNLRKIQIEIDFNEIENDSFHFLVNYFVQFNEISIKTRSRLLKSLLINACNLEIFQVIDANLNDIEIYKFDNLTSLSFVNCTLVFSKLCNLLKAIGQKLKAFEWLNIDKIPIRQVSCVFFTFLTNLFCTHNSNLNTLNLQIGDNKCKYVGK